DVCSSDLASPKKKARSADRALRHHTEEETVAPGGDNLDEEFGQAAFFARLVAFAAAALKLLSASSTACLVAAVTWSAAVFAAFSAWRMNVTMPSEPTGAFLASWSTAAWNSLPVSANCFSTIEAMPVPVSLVMS